MTYDSSLFQIVRVKIAVIGIGGSGSAALRFLASAGHEATGFEQFGIGHAMGSSHGHSRLIRRTYPDPFHTRRMDLAYRLWAKLEEEHGSELFVRCGGITFGPPGDGTLENTRRSLVEAGIAHEILSREETAERFPAIDIGEGAVAVFQRDSGFLRADRCVSAQTELARTHGAEIRERSPVLAVEEKAGRVFVSTAGETEAFDAAVVTAGPWIGRLLAPLRLPLRTALRQVVYLGIARRPESFAPGSLPVWIEHPSDHYGFPADGMVDGVKIASHDAGIDFDPSRPDRPVMEEALSRVRDHAMKRFPDLSGEIVSSQSCLYTITPDERFIVDYAPGSRRIVICSGCSGHGFKFTVLLGKIAAEMATGVNREENSTHWGLDRFTG